MKTFSISNKLKAWAMVSLTVLATVAVAPLTGCTVSQAQVVADGHAVSTALLSVAKIEAVTNPQAAENLTTASNALLAATSNWKPGSAVADINAAANAVEIVLAAIPQTAVFAPLVAIAVAALDVLIANTNSANPSVSAVANVYRGKAHIHHRFGRSKEGDFKAAWNAAVKANPALASAKLK